MKTVISTLAMGILGAVAVAGTADAEALTKMAGCQVTNDRVAYRGLTDSMQQTRYMVLETDQATGRVVVRTASGFVYDLSCHGTAVMMSTERPARIGALLPGDIVSIPASGELSLLRRPWDEAGSPER